MLRHVNRNGAVLEGARCGFSIIVWMMGAHTHHVVMNDTGIYVYLRNKLTL